jgi:hypothetical protein
MISVEIMVYATRTLGPASGFCGLRQRQRPNAMLLT